MIAAIFLYIFMVAGFFGACWCTNAFFQLFRKKDEQGRFDSVLALLIWGGLFGGYGYFLADWLH